MRAEDSKQLSSTLQAISRPKNHERETFPIYLF